MTDRLYYHDAFLKSFTANVTHCEPDPANTARFKVTLDRTAFYPTSGGQPHDLGTLGHVQGILQKLDEIDQADMRYQPITARLREEIGRHGRR